VVCSACGTENRDEARFCDVCGAPLAATAVQERRKHVTVLFCDVSGSTAFGERLDPETVRASMARYFDAAREAIERHGGTVEKFIGDAVMAVFGIPQSHEDDALRAVRAAFELRETVAFDVRIGINSGEVVTGSGDTLVTGDTVNVGARLEQSAAPGEILIGARTHELVRDAVDVELLPPLEARGKSQPLTQYRVTSIVGDAPILRRFDAPLVGRQRELRELGAAWERVRSERACTLFTVLGAPGVGKSRLSAELVRGLDGASIVSGRCLSYGEGITFWPVVEIVKQLLGDEAPGDPAIAALLGEGVATVDEIGYAVRRLLERSAADRGLVVVFDDIHWGEPGFLDLVEYVADWSRDAPILLLCLARPDLLDRRPAWAGGKLNATTLLLEPLGSGETEVLIDGLAGDAGITPELRSRILRAAEGNPLFVEEMLAMTAGQSLEGVTVPASIQALLAARIDGLPSSERSALERGAIEGQVFHRTAVQALAPEQPRPDGDLLGLVRKELVRPSPSMIPGDDAFRFRHLLIRDAAYESLSKSTRAELHQRFAAWLAEHGTALVELDEILGYHYERAALYGAELGTLDPHSTSAAAAHLAAAGLRAFERIDFHAAGNLLERALALLPDDDSTRVPLLATLAETVYGSGDLSRLEELLDETVLAAAAAGDAGSGARARAFRAFVGGHTGGPPLSELRSQMDELEAALAASGDAENLARVLTTRAWLTFWVGRCDDAVVDGRRAIEYARSAGSPGLEAEAAGVVASALRWGPAPWPELTAFIEERLAIGGPTFGGRLGAGLFDHRGAPDAATGNFDRARRGYAKLEQSLRDRGMLLFLNTLTMETGAVELRARDGAAAERHLRPAFDRLGASGEAGYRATVGTLLAEALVLQGRLDDAAALLDECASLAAEDDVLAQASIHTVRTLGATRRGDHDEAIEHGRCALEVIDTTDYAEQRVEARLALGEALLGAGRRAEAEVVLGEAIESAGSKGSTVLQAAARALLDRPS
jgi:class 3 adenylate cyclase/tetratricopeptide (TPR) repeat protein